MEVGGVAGLPRLGWRRIVLSVGTLGMDDQTFDLCVQFRAVIKIHALQQVEADALDFSVNERVAIIARQVTIHQ